MSIRGCRVLAIEGTHNVGKTTLAMALTAHYRAAGLNAGYVGDAARDSPVVADIVLHHVGRFDIAAELDVLTATISSQIRAAHRHQLLVVDKTAANALAYAHLLLPQAERHDDALAAARALCRAWQPYDLVICLHQQHRIDLRSDPFRQKVSDLQSAGHVIGRVLDDAGYPLAHMPAGLSLRQRVAWTARRATRQGLLRPTSRSVHRPGPAEHEAPTHGPDGGSRPQAPG